MESQATAVPDDGVAKAVLDPALVAKPRKVVSATSTAFALARVPRPVSCVGQ